MKDGRMDGRKELESGEGRALGWVGLRFCVSGEERDEVKVGDAWARFGGGVFLSLGV